MKKSFWVGILLMGCGRSVPTGSSSPTAAVAVSAVTVVEQKQAGQSLYPGTVKARRQAILATKLPGRITFLKVEEGDMVAAGSLVAEVDVSDLEARAQQAVAGRDSATAALQQSQAGFTQSQQGVAQARSQLNALVQQQSEAQARLELARKDEQRFRGLAQEGAVPRQRAEQALTELKVAQSRMAQLQGQILSSRVSIRQSQAGVAVAQSTVARSQAGISEAQASILASQSDLAYGRVLAPFRGVVVEKNAFEGELNTPGRPLVKLQDLDSLEVSLVLPESLLEQVQPGTQLKAEAPALHQKLDLKVRQIVASTDPASRSVEVRLALSHAPRQLFPGSFVRVSIPQPARSRLVLPPGVLVQRGQLDGVFVVSQGQAEFRLVQMGAAGEVLSGLEAGEQVISAPPETLQDGQKVTLP